MGLPALNIIFRTAAKESVKRSERGSVGMIVKGKAEATNPAIIYKEKDIPESLDETTKEQIKLALKGYVNTPSKIVLYTLSGEEGDYTKALDYFELHKVNWLCFPTIKTDKQEEAVKTWVKEQRDGRNKVKVVLPTTGSDYEGIIDYATESVSIGEKTYTPDQFCSRIAGLLAGTPITQSSTFAVLDDVTACTPKKRNEIDVEIDAGKLVVFYDGEKIKVARGVNSLTTITEEKGKPWQDITTVETMDMINDDLTILVEDNYIGKYRNNYDNKCLLLTAARVYLDELGKQGIIELYNIDLDAEAIRDYIVKNKGVSREDAEAMTDEEVKKQYTDKHIFMVANATVVETMEDITINFGV